MGGLGLEEGLGLQVGMESVVVCCVYPPGRSHARKQRAGRMAGHRLRASITNR